jgi:hypothetical protein
MFYGRKPLPKFIFTFNNFLYVNPRISPISDVGEYRIKICLLNYRSPKKCYDTWVIVEDPNAANYD